MVARSRKQVSRLLLRRGRLPQQSSHRVRVGGFGDFGEVEAILGCAWRVDVLGSLNDVTIEDLDLEMLAGG